MATSKIQTGLRLDETALEKIRDIANHQKRTLNSMLEYLVAREIDAFENSYGVITLDVESD